MKTADLRMIPTSPLCCVQPIPAVLEIPSKEHPYDPNQDSILERVKGLFGGDLGSANTDDKK